MSQETLSALFDGECTPEELERVLQDMERDPRLKAGYSRLCLAREAAEGTRIARKQACIAAGTMAAIAAEPMMEPGAKVTDLDSRRRYVPAQGPVQSKPWIKTFAGYAAAASVAAVAVMVAMPTFQAGKSGHADSFSAGVSAPGLSEVSMPMPVRPARAGVRAVSLTPEEVEQMNELNDLLLEHSGSVAEQSVGGTLRYARVAAHAQPAVYRPDSETAEDRR